MLNNLITTHINQFNANEANQVLNLLNHNKLEHPTGDYVETFIIGLNLSPCPESQDNVELNFIRDIIQDLDNLCGNTLTVNEELPYTYIITGPSDEGYTCTIMFTGSCIMISSMHGNL